MFKLNDNETKRKQSIGFLKNKFLDYIKEEVKVVGITTSLRKNLFAINTAKIIAMLLAKSENNKILLITSFEDDKSQCENNYDVLNFGDLEGKDLNDYFTTLEKKYNMILILLKPLNEDAQSLEYAKFCEKIFSVEKYQDTKYKNFEDLLYIMKVNKMSLDGVISYKG